MSPLAAAEAVTMELVERSLDMLGGAALLLESRTECSSSGDFGLVFH